MEERLKQRLVGAAVLASVAVVIVPIALDEPRDVNEDVSSTSISEIPERPQDRFETTVTTALELPQTPRLDAEVERERERQASGASAGDRRVESDAPARVSIATPSEAPAAPRVVVSGASGTEGAEGREESEAPAAPRAAVSGASGSSASAPAAESPAPAAVQPSDSSGNEQATEAPAAAGKWTVQLGSFLKAENASALRERLRARGYPAFVETSPSARGEMSRVLVGPMPDLGKAKDSAAKLKREMKLEGIVVPYPGG